MHVLFFSFFALKLGNAIHSLHLLTTALKGALILSRALHPDHTGAQLPMNQIENPQTTGNPRWLRMLEGIHSGSCLVLGGLEKVEKRVCLGLGVLKK